MIIRLNIKPAKPVLFAVFFFCAVFASAQNSGTWTWMKGSNTGLATAVWGTQGVAAPANTPGGLTGAAGWTDMQGNFWVFGGSDGSPQSVAEINALWKYDPVSNEWTWMKGSSSLLQPGAYGTQGVAAPGNNPGARAGGMATWVDLQGNLWLYGGYGVDANGNNGYLSDLWKYDISTNQWTWMKGNATVGYFGNFGTMGVPALTNEPGARLYIDASWVDNTGCFWLYGGIAGVLSVLNDMMWKFDPATNCWTWMSGSPGFSMPNWGTMGTTAPSNTPGGRHYPSHWVDHTGNLWLFGGYIYNGNNIMYNGADMWKYDISTNQWTWMAGSNVPDFPGSFTQKCTWGNGIPRSRNGCDNCWVDDCGRFWALGGFHELAPVNNPGGNIDDLWVFDPQTLEFNWIGGSTGYTYATAGNYGTQGVPAASNYPPGLFFSCSFHDQQGNFWFFGGADNYGWIPFNCLWRYQIDPNCPSRQLPDVSSNTVSDCPGTPVTFYPGIVNNNLSYQWDFGDPNSTTDVSNNDTATYTYTQSGTYTVTLIVSGNGLCSGPDTASIVITINPAPAIDLGADTIICPGQNILLDAANPGATYIWSTGESTQTISPSASGMYAVVVAYGTCTDGDSLHVQLTEYPQLGSQISLCDNPGAIVLDAGNPGATYQWSTGANSQSIVAENSGVYTVQINFGQCSFADTVEVVGSVSEGMLYVPNTFTPNKDGLNEIFKAKAEQAENFHLMIFNRWGEMIFESTDINTGWDGTTSNKSAAEDTYVYVIQYNYHCGAETQEKMVRGHVNLIR